MTVQANTLSKASPIGGIRFDWFNILTCFWLISGLLVDGWAHTHGRVDNTFFTPWHGVFYTGYLAVFFGVMGAFTINHRRGYLWQEAIPAGYRLTIIGLIIFGFGGVFDLWWHSMFGFEVEFSILMSPSHLLLGIGMFLILGGPLRAAWLRSRNEESASKFVEVMPRILSLLFLFVLCGFFTMSFNPIVNDFAFTNGRGNDMFEILGVASILVQSGLLSGFILIYLRRWKMPFGGFTLILLLQALALAIVSNHFFLAIPIGAVGLIMDVFASRAELSLKNPLGLRIFAGSLPALYFGLYFLAMGLRYGNTWWPVHVWTGAIVEAAIVGLFISYLIFTPNVTQSQND
jgi:hypothetical protein